MLGRKYVDHRLFLMTGPHNNSYQTTDAPTNRNLELTESVCKVRTQPFVPRIQQTSPRSYRKYANGWPVTVDMSLEAAGFVWYRKRHLAFNS